MIYILLGGVVALFVYEIWAARDARPGNTISELVWEGSRRSKALPFAFGFLMGHFFW